MRKSALDAVKDSSGTYYQPLLKCMINNIPDCYIISVPGQENALCWLDNNLDKHIDYNNAADVFAANMSFDQIDERFYDLILSHWDGLMMDEQIELYRNRDHVSEAISEMVDESEFYVAV
jgi:hypothetical protein